MASLRKIVALLLLPLIFTGVFVFIVGAAADTVILNGKTITAQLRAADAYAVATREVTHAIETRQPERASESSIITEKDLTAIATAVLDPVWLQQEIESNIDRLDGWLNHGRTLELSVDTTTRKSILTASLNALLDGKLASLPPCTTTPTYDSLDTLCIPKGSTSDDVRAEMKRSGIDIDRTVAALPDHIDLLNPQASLSPFLEKIGGQPVPPPTGTSSIAASLDRFRTLVSSFRTGMRLLLAGIIALIGIEGVLVALGRKTFFRWMSLLFNGAAVLPTVVGVIGVFGVGSFIDQRLPDTFATLLPETRQAIEAISSGLLSSLFMPIALAGISLFVIGIGLGVAAGFTKDRATHPRP